MRDIEHRNKWMRDMRQQRKARGICVNCKKPAKNYRCMSCAVKHAAKENKRRKHADT